jgi:hypothetical protein
VTTVVPYPLATVGNVSTIARINLERGRRGRYGT